MRTALGKTNKQMGDTIVHRCHTGRAPVILRIRTASFGVGSFMPAEILRCPSCGASASSEATRCEFCNAALATVTCPSCFGMMFAGAKFCSHCGAKGNRNEEAGREPRLCPRCQVAMQTVKIGTTELLECGSCEGIWVDVDTLQQICSDREKQAFAASVPGAMNQPLELERNIRYVPCPVCHELMNRVQFRLPVFSCDRGCLPAAWDVV